LSRILVIGVGTPGFLESRFHAGPGLRSQHFAAALAREGHDVLLLAVLAGHDPRETDHAGKRQTVYAPGAQPIDVELVREQDLLQPAMRRRIEAFAPDGVVGVTVYAAALAARLRLEAPLWADVFGDIMAEAQAKAARTGSDWSIVHFWTLLGPVLESADRFSAVSGAQAFALIGQLGLAGRLSLRTAGEELVATIPCAAEPPPVRADRRAARRDLAFDDEDFVLLLSGGVNTWCDVETIASGIAQAFAIEPRLRVVVTGGAIPGHDEASHAALAAGLGALGPANPPAANRTGRVEEEAASRVRILGWIDRADLAGVYAACDLALHIERPMYERTLGAENRVVEWLAHGLPLVTTALSETTADLARRGIAFSCKPGDASDLATEIVRLAHEPELLQQAARRGRDWVETERGYSRTARPLIEWCAAPHAARDRDGARLIRLGLLSHPETSVDLLEAYVAGLPVRELARRGVRWVWQRAWSATSRSFAAASRTVLQRLRAGRSDASKVRLPSLVALLAAAFSLTASGCNGGSQTQTIEHPNILLISIDTLRADHLGVYGYRVVPSPTPSIDRLAAAGVVFEHAISSAPETAPAVATLLTGVYQDRHNVVFNRAHLGDESITLAERLKEAGYATRAFVANWIVDPDHGFGQGFDSVEMIPGAIPGAALAYPSSDDRLAATVAGFLRTPPASPWFAWVHMMDPHGPYNSASPWWSRDFDYKDAPPARDGEFAVSDSNFGLGVIPAYQKLEGAKTLSDYVRRYDGEIRYTDTQLGWILAALAASDASGETIVVVTADHGESLVEHDELLQHGWFAYDPTVRVPLVIAWPGGAARPGGAAPKRVADEACSVDIVPTLLDLAGAAAGEDLDGRSLASELGFAAHPASSHAGELRGAGCYAVGPRPNHPIALRTSKLKAIVTPAGAPTDPRTPKGERSSEPERVELYDLTADPSENENIATSRMDVVEQMKPEIEKLRARFRANGWRW